MKSLSEKDRDVILNYLNFLTDAQQIGILTGWKSFPHAKLRFDEEIPLEGFGMYTNPYHLISKVAIGHIADWDSEYGIKTIDKVWDYWNEEDLDILTKKIREEGWRII